MKKFKEFQVDFLLESINESMLYMSPKIRGFLTDLDHEIGNRLRDERGTDVKPDMTFIDIDMDKPGYVTFVTMATALKNANNSALDGIDKNYDENIVDTVYNLDQRKGSIGIYTKKSRNSVKIGRLINKIFPKEFKDKDIEEFVNKFKAKVEVSGEKFELVKGEKIKEYYDGDNYLEIKGSLGSSCMRNSPSEYFNIYSDNPNQVQMLVLLEEEKVKGRAIIWKISNSRPDEGIEYFMDRRYTILDSDNNKFLEYAKKEGWAWKTYNNHSDISSVTVNGVDKYVNLEVELDKSNFNFYPYMDTMKALRRDSGIIFNEEDADTETIVLDDTAGGFTENGYYSEWEGTTIPENEAVYSEYMNDWIYRNDAVEIAAGRHEGEVIHAEHDSCIYSSYSEYYLVDDDAVYSSYHDSAIYSGEAYESVIEIQGLDNGKLPESSKSMYCKTDWVHEDEGVRWIDDDTPWYSVFRRFHNLWVDNMLSGLVEEDLNGYVFPKVLAIDVYEVLGEYKVDYLTEMDAELLDVAIDNEIKTLDIIGYNRELEDTGVSLNIERAIEGQRSQLKIEFEEDYYSHRSKEEMGWEKRLSELEWGRL